MNRRNLLGIAIAAIVALWWWQRENRGAVLPLAEDPVRLSLTNSTLYQYDADGAQVSVLHSPQAEHLKNGEDRLHQPEMRVRLKNGERSLRAAQVAVGEDAEQAVAIADQRDAQSFVGDLEERGLYAGVARHLRHGGVAAHDVADFGHQAPP